MVHIQSLLTKPYKGASVLQISQGFHAGHLAIDIVSKYGTPLVAPENCKVIGIWGDGPITTDNEDLKRGYGIKLKGVVSGLEHLYWHTQPVFPVDLFESVAEGRIVAFMGNAGTVTVGGKYVPIDERTSAPYRGTHLHQVVVSAKAKPLDPVPLIDWQTEPTYGKFELIGAWIRVLGKMSKLIV